MVFYQRNKASFWFRYVRMGSFFLGGCNKLSLLNIYQRYWQLRKTSQGGQDNRGKHDIKSHENDQLISGNRTQ